MADSQQNLVRLQDFDFITGANQNKNNIALIEKEHQKIVQEFAQTDKEINAFLAKIFPQAIDVICSLNKLITRKGKILFFKNQEVQSISLSHDNCLNVCKKALSTFPNTVNTMVKALKSRAEISYIEEISRKLCCEFNTISAFQTNSEQLKAESIAQIDIKPVNIEIVDNTNNFSEEIIIPIGKKGEKEVSIELNVLRPDAHAVIAGMSGSGKSSLLQSIILGGAYKYSPEQLHFWILDFKDGTGLIQFKGLKHVRMMSVKNRAIDANEIMDYIKSEYTRRAELIANSGGGDITDYNERAKAENKPLMPRLLIIIDEFAVMHRSCFSVLNDIARLGRSMGIGFVLSSQIIETGAAYGDAVQQANHLFEFKNSDSAFGRLVKNVSDEEKRFACSGVIGNCIYRRDNTKTAFRVAYAGEIGEQNALIKKINDKWSNFPYIKPIITGRPERKIKSIDSFNRDGSEIKGTYKRTKKVFVPIGESRMGTPYLYKIDRDNPVLVLFGDEARVASVELSVIEHFKNLSESEKSVYYIDLNCNPDRELNAVTAKFNEDSRDICYVASDSGAKRVIDKVYKILKNRRQLSTTDRTKDIGNPIELVIHNAERISELKDEKRTSKIGALTRKQPDISADMDLDEILSSQSKDDISEKEDDIDTLKKLSEIIEKGKNSRIYVMLYFEENNRFQALTNNLFTYNFDFKDVLVVPRIPDDYEELSYSEVVDSLTACRLREQASVFDMAKLIKSDFICSVLVDDKVPHKIIPYEWAVEEN